MATSTNLLILSSLSISGGEMGVGKGCVLGREGMVTLHADARLDEEK